MLTKRERCDTSIYDISFFAFVWLYLSARNLFKCDGPREMQITSQLIDVHLFFRFLFATQTLLLLAIIIKIQTRQSKRH